jgi:hypothetical protein
VIDPVAAAAEREERAARVRQELLAKLTDMAAKQQRRAGSSDDIVA